MSISLEGAIDYVGLAGGIAIGFAVFLPMYSSIQNAMRKNGNR